MHWSHTSRQGWLVVAAGMALLGGCGAPAAPDATSPPETPQRPAEARTMRPGALLRAASEVVQRAAPLTPATPRHPLDGMPLLAGANVSAMPVIHPEEQVAPMPGGANVSALPPATQPGPDDSFILLRAGQR